MDRSIKIRDFAKIINPRAKKINKKMKKKKKGEVLQLSRDFIGASITGRRNVRRANRSVWGREGLTVHNLIPLALGYPLLRLSDFEMPAAAQCQGQSDLEKKKKKTKKDAPMQHRWN